ncbi:MAG TPA: hypothetical protein VD694_01090, partial [Nitrososphaeraceae archaeon]|nr:hypothetical protein [Nitrososphaeraceae archaeon]
MSSIEQLRQIVQNLVESFNDTKVRESAYFDFYDDTLNIHGFPQVNGMTEFSFRNGKIIERWNLVDMVSL